MTVLIRTAERPWNDKVNPRHTGRQVWNRQTANRGAVMDRPNE